MVGLALWPIQCSSELCFVPDPRRYLPPSPPQRPLCLRTTTITPPGTLPWEYIWQWLTCEAVLMLSRCMTDHTAAGHSLMWGQRGGQTSRGDRDTAAVRAGTMASESQDTGQWPLLPAFGHSIKECMEDTGHCSFASSFWFPRDFTTEQPETCHTNLNL